MRIHLSVILLIWLSLYANSQQTGTGLKYRGGMLFHSGYLKNAGQTNTLSGICYGIGGQLTFTPKDHFRAGIEGYASNLSYKARDGYFKLGWGGLLLGYQFGYRTIRPVLSFTLGGGKVSDMQFIEVQANDNEIDQVLYRKYAVMLASPSVSAEYAMKSKLTLIIKIDYLLPLFGSYNAYYAYGPRLYLGILFNRQSD